MTRSDIEKLTKVMADLVDMYGHLTVADGKDGACVPASMALARLLRGRGAKTQLQAFHALFFPLEVYRAAIQNDAPDLLKDQGIGGWHVAVIAHAGGNRWLADPTAHQFARGKLVKVDARSFVAEVPWPLSDTLSLSNKNVGALYSKDDDTRPIPTKEFAEQAGLLWQVCRERMRKEAAA
jgi:hypothetical protein